MEVPGFLLGSAAPYVVLGKKTPVPLHPFLELDPLRKTALIPDPEETGGGGRGEGGVITILFFHAFPPPLFCC